MSRGQTNVMSDATRANTYAVCENLTEGDQNGSRGKDKGLKKVFYQYY